MHNTKQHFNVNIISILQKHFSKLDQRMSPRHGGGDVGGI